MTTNISEDWDFDREPPVSDRRTSMTQGELAQVELERWWRKHFEGDLDLILPKIHEYSAKDLEVMGAAFEALGWAPEGKGSELACQVYLLGKVARSIGAYAEGNAPSIDTLHDQTVYTMMTRRIRELGVWP
jgi:hypothetical protein